jgi:hypothetical protein
MSNCKTFISLFLGILLCFVIVSSAYEKTLSYKYTFDIISKNQKFKSLKFGNYQIRIKLLDDDYFLELLDKDGLVIFKNEYVYISLSYEKKFGQKKEPFIIIQGRKQGLDSPYELIMLNTLGKPKVLTLSNGYGFWLQDDCDDGNLRIWTSDDSFQGDPEMLTIPVYDVYVPFIVLDQKDGALISAIDKCKKYSELKIARNMNELLPKKVEEFRLSKIEDEYEREKTKGIILNVVCLYLYTGLQEEAKNATLKMWPKSDQKRIWAWLLNKRTHGVLSRLNEQWAGR